MIARIISTLLLWTLVVAAIFYGGTFGWALVLWCLAAGALAEATTICKRMGLTPLALKSQIACVAIMICGAFGFDACIVATILCLFLLLSLLINPYDSYWRKTLLPTILLIIAIPFMLQWLVLISLKYGVIFSVMILASAKFSDVGAFVFGKAFGRHKLAPEISPNKTWEGALGGIFSSAVVAAAITWGFYGVTMNSIPLMPKNFLPTDALWVGALIGACAIVSDLIESIFKRRADIKDSGGIIPGIGGTLDLADSILLSAPLGMIIAICMNLNCN